jgi:DNA-binding transcriptional regulator YiaG
MTIWHNHEGAARLMLWLLFKTKLGNGPIRAGTLLKVAFGAEKVEAARKYSASRKRLVSQWRTTIQVLDKQGWKFIFDLETYPPQYLPDLPDLLPLTEIPDDPEAALEFWSEDAAKQPGDRLTDVVRRPYGGFEQLLTARMLVQPPEEIARKLEEIRGHRPLSPHSNPGDLRTASSKKPRKSERRTISTTKALPTTDSPTPQRIETGEQLKALRLTRGMTQGTLAEKLGKSVSWVKLVETGRRNITPTDQTTLAEILQAPAQ